MCDPHRLSVLVVDDHPDSAESLADLLRMHGHRAAVAHTAPEALAAADIEPPDVVLLDIRLPGIDGWQLARWLREQASVRECPRPFLVAVSGCGQAEDFQRSAEAGIDLHIIKPAEPDLLMRLLNKLPHTMADSSQVVDVAAAG